MKFFKTKEDKMKDALKEHVSKLNFDVPNNMCELIDERLNILLKKLECEDYISFIKSNKNLALYDDTLGKYANNNPLSNPILHTFTDEFYKDILKTVNDKIKQLNINA